jgi:hypothetical protein
MNRHGIEEMGKPMEKMFSMRLVLEPYKYERKTLINVTRVKAGSNTSTVTLRVVESDEKEILESEAVKYGHESHGTRTRQ